MSNIEKPQFVQSLESFILPLRLLFDSEVPLSTKLIPSTIFVLYLILPIDIISDFIPVAGAVDDLAILTLCGYLLIRLTPEVVLKKYQEKSTKNTSNSKKEEVIIKPKNKKK